MASKIATYMSWFISIPLKGNKLENAFFLHVRYLKTYQHCVSLLLGLWVSVQFWQSLPLPTGTSSTHVHKKGQSSCNPTAMNKAVEYLAAKVFCQNCHLQVQPTLRVYTCVHKLQYFVRVWSMWNDYVNLTIYGKIPGVVTHVQQ